MVIAGGARAVPVPTGRSEFSRNRIPVYTQRELERSGPIFSLDRKAELFTRTPTYNPLIPLALCPPSPLLAPRVLSRARARFFAAVSTFLPIGLAVTSVDNEIGPPSRGPLCLQNSVASRPAHGRPEIQKRATNRLPPNAHANHSTGAPIISYGFRQLLPNSAIIQLPRFIPPVIFTTLFSRKGNKIPTKFGSIESLETARPPLKAEARVATRRNTV